MILSRNLLPRIENRLAIGCRFAPALTFLVSDAGGAVCCLYSADAR
jgi:hypothetical protein